MAAAAPGAAPASPAAAAAATGAARADFDDPGFDAVAHVNRLFPDEDSLSGVGAAIEEVRAALAAADADILAAAAAQAAAGAAAAADLAAARAAAAELQAAVAGIRDAAAASDALVADICRDVRRLDAAKRHLTAAVTGLRRLAMLVAAVERLQLAAERHEYADAAHLLGATHALLAHFSPHAAAVPRVAEMRGRVAGLEASLRIAALREFELVGEAPPPPALLDRLRAAAAVAGALGGAARDELVDAVCRREVGVYTAIFGTTGETARLDRVVNRYKWLLRRLEARRELLAAFPPDWRLPALLCASFAAVTRAQLAEILDTRAAELPGQVDALLKAVEATNIFEGEMVRRFGSADERADLAAAEAGGGVGAGAGGAPAPAPAERPDGASGGAAAAAAARAAWRGCVSSVFARHLGVYVDHAERELMWALDAAVRDETWRPLAPGADAPPLLRSANELVAAVREELGECCRRVSRGRALLDLAAVFGRVFRAYAARLAARLPRTAGGAPAAGAAAALGASEWHVRLADGDVEVICLIVATADHCAEMVRQLGRAVAARLEPPLGAADVDVSAEEDEFASVATAALAALLLGVETRLEGPLLAAARRNWAAVDAAGDVSEWAVAARGVLADAARRLGGGALPPGYARFWADRLVRSLAPRLREAVFRCRRVSQQGAAQLRLDLEAVRGGLAGLARAALPPADAAEVAAAAAAAVGRVEAVLKVAATPPAAMADAFFELLGGASPAEFARIAELRGLRRGEAAAVVEAFNARAGRPALQPAMLAAAAADADAAVAAAPAAVRAADVAARFRLGANQRAAKASDSMKESLAKSLRFLNVGGSSGRQP